jgi:hypothetical protein
VLVSCFLKVQTLLLLWVLLLATAADTVALS